MHLDSCQLFKVFKCVFKSCEENKEIAKKIKKCFYHLPYIRMINGLLRQEFD